MATVEDLSLVSGDFILIEYVERYPVVLQNLGMASRILNFYRVSTDGSANVTSSNTAGGSTGSFASPLGGGMVVGGGGGGLKRMASDEPSAVAVTALSLGGNSLHSVTVMFKRKRKRSFRLPRHLQYLLDDRRRIAVHSSDQDLDVPKLPEGQTVPLEEDDDMPFLGDIAPGALLQALVNNLYQTPLFRHEPHPGDYLIIRVARPKGSLGLAFVMRPIPALFLSGQQEPQRVVPKPSRKVSRLQEELALLSISRYFDNVGDALVTADDVFDEMAPAMLKNSE